MRTKAIAALLVTCTLPLSACSIKTGATYKSPSAACKDRGGIAKSGFREVTCADGTEFDKSKKKWKLDD